MTTRERLIKNLYFLVVLVYYVGGYLLLNWWTDIRGVFHTLTLPYEETIPFIPYLIFAYLLIYGLIAFTYIAIDDLPFFRKVVWAFMICITIHFIFFLLYPVRYTLRPPLPMDEGSLLTFVRFYYWLDLPNNCFPSMHVSNSFLVAFVFSQYWPRSRWVFLFLAVLVAVSVVLVKQHYIVDSIGGLVVALAVFRCVFKTWPVYFPHPVFKKIPAKTSVTA